VQKSIQLLIKAIYRLCLAIAHVREAGDHFGAEVVKPTLVLHQLCCAAVIRMCSKYISRVPRKVFPKFSEESSPEHPHLLPMCSMVKLSHVTGAIRCALDDVRTHSRFHQRSRKVCANRALLAFIAGF
jgi:hypothetical protein